MIENVLRARGEHPDRPAHDLIREAAAEVARPVIFAVAIIIIVYVPILALEGVAGKMFAPHGAHGDPGTCLVADRHPHPHARAGGDLPRRAGYR